MLVAPRSPVACFPLRKPVVDQNQDAITSDDEDGNCERNQKPVDVHHASRRRDVPITNSITLATSIETARTVTEGVSGNSEKISVIQPTIATADNVWQ